MSFDPTAYGATPAGFRINGPIGDQLTAAAQKYGVDVDLVHSLAQQESGGNPHAQSPKGALGVMQLMPHTAQQLGVDPTDATQNIDGGVRYLKQQLDKYGDQDKALAAYNAGPAAVDAHNGVPPYKETQNYVKSINSRLAPPAAQAPASATQAPAAPAEAFDPMKLGATEAKDEPFDPAKLGATPAEDKQTSSTPKFTEHPWDFVNTPTADLITGQSHYLKNKLNSVFSDKNPEQFAQDHPWISGGENIGEGLTSPLGLVLAAGGPLAEGMEAVPGLAKLAPVLNTVRKGANIAVAGEGAINAGEGASDIYKNGANIHNVTQTGLGTLQTLLGAHGATEMSSNLDKLAPTKWGAPEGTTLGDIAEQQKTAGVSPTLGQAAQSPTIIKLENYLGKTYAGSGPLERNWAANQDAISSLPDQNSVKTAIRGVSEAANDADAGKTLKFNPQDLPPTKFADTKLDPAQGNSLPSHYAQMPVPSEEVVSHGLSALSPENLVKIAQNRGIGIPGAFASGAIKAGSPEANGLIQKIVGSLSDDEMAQLKQAASDGTDVSPTFKSSWINKNYADNNSVVPEGLQSKLDAANQTADKAPGGAHSLSDILFGGIAGHTLHAGFGPAGAVATPIAENIISRLLASPTFTKIMLTPSKGAATAVTRGFTRQVSQ
jgi:hypothetical protein